MKKILWHGEYLNTTGFSMVTKNLVKYLKADFDITVLDWQKFMTDNSKTPMSPIQMDGFKLLGCLTETDEMAALQLQFMDIHLFDCVFIINDVWNIHYILQILKYREYKGEVYCYFPVDAEKHDALWYSHFDLVTRAVTYTQFARAVVLEAAPEIEDKLSIIPHGINTETFFPITDLSKNEIREKIYGSDKFNDKLIFLNANRNQTRKRLDITMEAFAAASKVDSEDKMRLHMHCGNTDSSMNILELAKRFNIEERLIMSSPLDYVGMIKLEESDLNLIYNACNFGINTSMGEGWGLTNHEMGACGKPQIVPEHSSCMEIFSGLGPLIKIKADFTFDNIMTVGKLVSPASLAGIMVDIVKGHYDYAEWSKKTLKKLTSPELLWSNIAETWKLLFSSK